MPHVNLRRVILAVFACAVGAMILALGANPASAHGFSSVVYVNLTAPEKD